ncbi:UvrD-helicase domain-containing protein, partial [Acidiferrobacter sp.]
MMTPDAEVRRIAADPNRSLVVQAPAGSGKTALLIQRYLALLARVDAPEEILALTFTRKAAEEMRARVLAALADDPSSPRETDYEREVAVLAQAAARRGEERDWCLAECPGRLRIQTFDAFCAQVVNQWPAAAGAGVALEVEPASKALYAEAARATFASLGQDDAVGRALADLLPALANDVDRFVDLVSELLGRREQWLPIVLATGQAAPEAARARLEGVFARLALEAMARAQALFPEEALPGTCAYLATVEGDLEWQAAGLTLGGPEALRLWQRLATRFLTASGTLRKQLKDWPKELGSVRAFMAQFVDPEGLAAALAELVSWGDCAYGEGQWQRLSALLRILPAASAELQLVFARHGRWDFTEAALRALQALGSEDEPTAGTLRLDRRLRHVLVDEFQDTSVLQYRLLERLTSGWVAGEERSLFVVGDPMQSIYSFRKAEVGLFLKLVREGLGSWPLESVALSANFRSRSGLVGWINDAFARLLPQRFIADEGAVPHARAIAARGAGGAVHVHGLVDVDMATEARYVARLVAGIRAERADAEIAILVRSRGHGHAIAEAMTAAGLRFAGDDLYSLGTRPLIRDLLALTETLMFPAARLSALSVLRAPWCGLDVADLVALCEGDRRPLIDILGDAARLGSLSEDGRLRAARVRDVLAVMDGERGRGSLAQRVEETWLALKGPAALATPTAFAEAEVFFQALGELEEAGEVDIWRLREHLEDLYAPPDPQASGLHILTIHKAKGLEYDVVVCPGLGRKTRGDHRPLLLALETEGPDGLDLLLAPLKAHDEDKDPLYDAMWDFATRRREHEVRRLLYVACTRAREALHLVGHARARDDGSVQPGGLLSVLWPVIEESFAQGQVAPELLVDTAPPRVLGLCRVGRGAFETPLSWGTVGDREGHSAPPAPIAFDWAGSCIRIVGTVVHELLAGLTDANLPEGTAVPDHVVARAEGLQQPHGL